MKKDYGIMQEMYDLGKNDAEISRVLKCCTETVRQWRLKNNYPKNFRYKDTCKINVEKLKQLVNDGLKDSEIAKILNVSIDGVYGSRMRNNIDRPSFSIAKMKEATLKQRNILIGTLLGDSSLCLSEKSINPRFKCEHGLKQKEYCYYKYELLESLGMKYNHRKRSTPDKRTGLLYESYSIESVANPYYLEIYNNLYINKTKVITDYILKDFNAESLAFMFMDDGYKINNSIGLATNCFTKKELNNFIKFLKNKFDLNFNIHNENTLYLICEDTKKFISIVFPYLHETMYYKVGLQKL